MTKAANLAALASGPAFSAYSSVGTSIPNNVYTKVLYQTEEYDTNNNYDNTTSRFQPTVAGYYQVNWSTGVTTQAEKFTALYKNGSFYRAGSDSIGWWSAGSALVYMNGTTDYLEVYFYQTTGSTQTTYTPQAAFSAALVRAA